MNDANNNCVDVGYVVDVVESEVQIVQMVQMLQVMVYYGEPFRTVSTCLVPIDPGAEAKKAFQANVKMRSDNLEDSSKLSM